VKNRFQSLPFKCNLQRYTVDVEPGKAPSHTIISTAAVGLYTL
jgi:hypothetical protein